MVDGRSMVIVGEMRKEAELSMDVRFDDENRIDGRCVS